MKDIPLVEAAAPNPTLAIHGGKPVREEPMPVRMALGDAEIKMLNQAIAYYRERNVDPGYQGAFERLYTDGFVNMMNGGYADAVATGTAALYVAVAALDLPKGSEVLVSPITDPGTLSAIILMSSAAGVPGTSASSNCKLKRAAVYVRRRPERSAAYQVVRENLETWLAQRRAGRRVAGANCYLTSAGPALNVSECLSA